MSSLGNEPLNNEQPRQERLGDLEAVKWVIGCFRSDGQARRLTAEEITAVADIQMYQPYPAEPGTWANVDRNLKDHVTVMAIVATSATERGAALVADGTTYTTDQSEGLAIGAYAEQQSRLKQLSGECSEGCSQTHVQLTQRGGFARQVCRHTLLPCKSCEVMVTAKRIELLERLLIQARLLFDNQWNVAIDKAVAINGIIEELDSPVDRS